MAFRFASMRVTIPFQHSTADVSGDSHARGIGRGKLCHRAMSEIMKPEPLQFAFLVKCAPYSTR